MARRRGRREAGRAVATQRLSGSHLEKAIMTNEPVPVFSNGKTVTGIPMPHYLDWVANGQEGKRFAEQIFLPSIQRGFVWGPSKIVNLWDSLLRGMPIGSMLINGLRKREKVFSSTNIQGQILSLKKDALGLLDGQQRTLAMLLGWPSEREDDRLHLG